MTIPSSRSLLFEMKTTGSELDWDWEMRGLFPLTSQTDVFGRLRTSSEDFGPLRSGIFRNDRAVFKNPSSPRKKISRLYFRKSWQVYYIGIACMSICALQNSRNVVLLTMILFIKSQGFATYIYSADY